MPACSWPMRMPDHVRFTAHRAICVNRRDAPPPGAATSRPSPAVLWDEDLWAIVLAELAARRTHRTGSWKNSRRQCPSQLVEEPEIVRTFSQSDRLPLYSLDRTRTTAGLFDKILHRSLGSRP